MAHRSWQLSASAQPLGEGLKPGGVVFSALEERPGPGFKDQSHSERSLRTFAGVASGR